MTIQTDKWLHNYFDTNKKHFIKSYYCRLMVTNIITVHEYLFSRLFKQNTLRNKKPYWKAQAHSMKL